MSHSLLTMMTTCILYLFFLGLYQVFYRIVPNEESEWDMVYYPMSSIEQAGFDEKQKNFIFTVNGRSIKLKIRKRNGFQEDQQAELHDFFTTISQALQKNKALNV